MKLNKKGFAFSTMLYGCVALIAAVLYLILNINKESMDTTYYFGEELYESLNSCVTEEIRLENCYSSESNPANCNPTAYHACLGVSDSNIQEKGTLISEKIKELVPRNADKTYVDPYTTSGNGIYADPYDNSRFIYVGDNVNNYIMYGEKVWRILSVEVGGYLKLVDTSKISDIAWDSTWKGVWSESSLYSTLNSNYITSITDNSKLFQGDWIAGIIYPSASTTYGITDLLEEEKDTGNAKTAAKVGILSVSDYMKATTNQKCKTHVIFNSAEENNEAYNCNSWLSQYKGWTMDISGEQGSDTQGYAYYFDNKVSSTNPSQIEKYNLVIVDQTKNTHDVYPIIYLDRNSVYLAGDGTQASPYVLK